jgi:hypothetical protein
MKQILLSLFFCAFLTANLFAQDKLLQELIDLPAPPPIAKTNNENGEKPPRSEEFYDKKNVPPDDAPIEDIFDYWKRKADSSYYGNDKPPQISIKNAARLLEQFSKEPKNLAEFLKVLPNDSKTAESIKNIFDISQNAEGIEEIWRESVKRWLQFNSKFYLDEVAAEVSRAKDEPKYGTVAKQDGLVILTKLDWETAKPILNRLENDTANIRTSTLAKTLIYKNAIAVKDNAEIEKYRKELKAIVSDILRLMHFLKPSGKVKTIGIYRFWKMNPC